MGARRHIAGSICIATLLLSVLGKLAACTSFTASPVDDAGGLDAGGLDAPADAGGLDAPADAGGLDTPADAAACAPPRLLINGRCYFVAAAVDPGGRLVHRIACEKSSPKGHLATFATKRDQDDVHAMLLPLDTVWFGLTAASGTNDKSLFNWETDSGKPAYEAWDPGSPDSGGDPNEATGCAVIQGSTLWADKSCSAPFRGLCEQD